MPAILGLIAGLILLFVEPDWFVGQDTVGWVLVAVFGFLFVFWFFFAGVAVWLAGK